MAHQFWSRAASVAVLTTVALVAGGSPALAHGDRDRIDTMRQQFAADANIPVITSPNVKLVSSKPGEAGISGCFARTAPLFVMSNLDSIHVYDVSKPAQPTLTGVLPNLVFENEAMNCGERRTRSGTQRFALVGVDLHQVSPDDIEHANDPVTRGGDELVIVDLTDPSSPHVRSRVKTSTGTHTVACIQKTDCRYAYSSGERDTFSVLDLRNLDKPREVDANPRKKGLQPFHTPTGGHKWNFDNAGFGTHTGYEGSGMFDVSNPRRPRLVTTTGKAGRGEHPDFQGYNDFIHHNSFRPNAKAFVPRSKPSFANGNILLVTEEDYVETDCAKAGSFQAWHVRRLDGRADAIRPLDKVELADLGTFPVPQGAFCSAHWFDYHPSGIVSIGYYGGGTQFVDVRHPRRLKAYGHATWGASEVWDAYWVPRYDKKGRAKGGRKTNLVYSVDLVRGLDVYSVDLPGREPQTTGLAVGSTSPFALDGPVAPAALGGLGVVGLVLLRRRAARRDA